LYAPLIYSFFRKRRVQDADALDLTQDVMKRVAGTIKRWNYDRAHGSFRGWLFTLVQNRLTDFWRQESRREKPAGGRRPDPDVSVADSQAEWDDFWKCHLLRSSLEIIKADFSPSTWQAFWMTRIEGIAVPETAATLGLSVAAVYLARSRVLMRLREQIRMLTEPTDEWPLEGA